MEEPSGVAWWMYVVLIAANVCGCVCAAYAFVIMKRASCAYDPDQLNCSALLRCRRNCTYVSASTLLLFSAGLEAISLRWWPLMMVAPFSALTIAFNVFFGAREFGERLGRMRVFANFMLMVGVMGTIASYSVLQNEHVRSSVSADGIAVDTHRLLSGALMTFGIVWVCQFAADSVLSQEGTGFVFAKLATAAVYGGTQNVCMKLIASWSGAVDAVALCSAVALFAVMGISQLTHVNAAAAVSDTSAVLPLYQAGISVCGMLGGVLAFREMSDLSAARSSTMGAATGLAASFLILLLGVTAAAVSMNKQTRAAHYDKVAASSENEADTTPVASVFLALDSLPGPDAPPDASDTEDDGGPESVL